MIKFFRHIRQRLLKEGKTTRYLTYAFGEIVLVVIGILIALSINNWNQERLESHKEDTYLDNLETDLKHQIASIDIQLDYENKYVNAAKPILEAYFKDSQITIDSASSQNLSILFERKTFVKTDPTYQDLISTGNIGLIKDQELRKSLLQYYIELERYEKIIQNNNTLQVDEMFGQNMVLQAYMGASYQRLFDISNELLKDPERELVFINIIELRGAIAQWHVVFMNELKEKTSNMLNTLKNSRE